MIFPNNESRNLKYNHNNRIDKSEVKLPKIKFK